MATDSASISIARAESNAPSDFERVMGLEAGEGRPEVLPVPAPSQARIEIDADQVKNGVAQLVLTVVKLIHELLERQAIRRIEAGSLTDDETERIGLALMKQARELERIREEFGLDDEDLNLDLGPLGKLL